MAVKTEKELNETQRGHWLKAVAAIELRNFGYAISLLQAILKQEPEFLTGRQLLRRTEVTPVQTFVGNGKPFVRRIQSLKSTRTSTWSGRSAWGSQD